MTKRISNENLTYELISKIKDLNQGEGVSPSILLESLIAMHWDFDANDYRQASAEAFANAWMYLDIPGNLHLTNEGDEKVKLNSIEDNK